MSKTINISSPAEFDGLLKSSKLVVADCKNPDSSWTPLNTPLPHHDDLRCKTFEQPLDLLIQHLLFLTLHNTPATISSQFSIILN